MLIAHLSDFHIFTTSPKPALIRADIADAVRKIVADVVAFTPRIDAVMLTGDLADGGHPNDYALLREIMSPLAVPVFAIPGNHDDRANLRAAFQDVLPFEDDVFLHYETHFQGMRILALDTVIEGSPAGALCPKRLAWIETKLAKPFAGETLILMHHPPYISGLRFLDNIGLVAGKHEFGAMVAGMPGRARILSGHIHRTSMSCWNGAFAMIAGSPAFTVELDLHPHDDEPPLVDAPYAYFIHSLDASGDFAAHPRYVRL